MRPTTQPISGWEIGGFRVLAHCDIDDSPPVTEEMTEDRPD